VRPDDEDLINYSYIYSTELTGNFQSSLEDACLSLDYLNSGGYLWSGGGGYVVDPDLDIGDIVYYPNSSQCSHIGMNGYYIVDRLTSPRILKFSLGVVVEIPTCV